MKSLIFLETGFPSGITAADSCYALVSSVIVKGINTIIFNYAEAVTKRSVVNLYT